MRYQLIGNCNRNIFKKITLGIHTIPYHLQYECRDFYIKHEEKPTDIVLINREKYIKRFNPYLKSNVSENLDVSLVKFYQGRYIRR